MRRKLGPAETFYRDLNDTFDACCLALNDTTETNDTPSLRLLAKALSMLYPGSETQCRDAQIALSCQFYLLPAKPAPLSRKSTTSLIIATVAPVEITITANSPITSFKTAPSTQPSRAPSTLADMIAPSTPTSKPISNDKGIDSPQLTPSQPRSAPLSPPSTPPVAKTTDKGNKERSPSRGRASRTRERSRDSNSSRDNSAAHSRRSRSEEARYAFNNQTILECALCNKTLKDFTEGNIYTCVYCTNVDLCEECYHLREAYHINTSEKKMDDYVEVCPWGHTLIESPMKGWKGVRADGVMEYDGEEILFSDWLDGLRGRWERSWDRYWREVEQ
ncbi:hypothetical protein QBC35DRAFT_51377 [Podospora australis]|uniref:ZZ-type domain-containing protein n=1 Tax=Podospora australis TaxID=1536484 RepID=A0AAN7AEP7_9PEZI|nr:hypothetical protein QBC35DRAFT_51377 [Podospora australis]